MRSLDSTTNLSCQYDLHGVWDAEPYIAPHTNLTEIDQRLDLLWRAGVSADKVVSCSPLMKE